jgi:hypothetical protein
MNNLNVGVLVSSVLAVTGLGVYVYMNNNNNNEQLESLNNEHSNDDAMLNEEGDNFYETDKNIKSNKKTVNVKSKRRNAKTTGTRRKRY